MKTITHKICNYGFCLSKNKLTPEQIKKITILPNELIIDIYTNLPFEDTFNSLEIFPFLNFLVKKKLKNINKHNIWTNFAIKGNLEGIKWLSENLIEGCNTYTMDLAASHGHLEIVKFLHENRTEGCSRWAIDFSAMNGYLEVIKWLHKNRLEGFSTNAIAYAASRGNLEIVKWLHENGKVGCTFIALDWAESKNHIHVVKYLKENRESLGF